MLVNKVSSAAEILHASAYAADGMVHKDLLLEADAQRSGIDLDLGYPEFAETLRASLADCLRAEHKSLLPSRDAVLRRPWWALVLIESFLEPRLRAARWTALWVTVATAIAAGVAILLFVRYGGRPSMARLGSALAVAALAVLIAAAASWCGAWLRFLCRLAGIDRTGSSDRQRLHQLLDRTEQRWPRVLWQAGLRRLSYQARAAARLPMRPAAAGEGEKRMLPR